MKRFFVLSLCFLLHSFSCQAGSFVFDYNDRCRQAYQKYMSLQPDDGSRLIREEIRENPYNLIATYLADYEDFLHLVFNGNRLDYDQRRFHQEERLKLLSKGPENSPWYRFLKSGIYFHWAVIHIRFGENFKAATSFRKSFLYIKENQKLFPQFKQNQIILGLEEAVIGSIPEDYKWLASLLGMKGSVKNGVNMVTAFVSSGNEQIPMYQEAVIYDCYLRFYLMSQQEEVWKYLENPSFHTKDNLFYTFVKANIAVNFRKAEAAIALLKTAEKQENYKDYPILDYELGTALLYKNEGDAIFYFRRFLQHYKASFYIKDALQKMAQYYYLHNDLKQANEMLQKVKTMGGTIVDADKQALRFSQNGVWPAADILQARLLIDGGYNQQALEKLSGMDVTKIPATSDQLEYYFRLGRVYDATGNETKAFGYYQTTITKGRERKEHFAARAALQMGFIYERSGKIKEAIAKFEEALSMRGHDFQANIDQQAKAGINRLSKQ